MWFFSMSSTLGVSFLIMHLLVQSHRASLRQQLQTTSASLLSLGISDFSQVKDFDELSIFLKDALGMEQSDSIIRIFDAKRDLVFSSVGLDYDLLPNRLEDDVNKPEFVTLSIQDRDYESLILPYKSEKKRQIFYLQLAVPIPKYWGILRLVAGQILLLFLVLLSLSYVLSWGLSRRLMRPVKEIALYLKGLDPLSHDSPALLTLKQEGGYLQDIAQGINQLAQRIRESVYKLRNMGRYVAHEMRNPLTILQGEAETVLAKKQATREDYAQVLRSSLEEVQRISQIVTTVLQVGELTSREAAFKPKEIDLSVWLRQQVGLFERSLGWGLSMNIAELGDFRVMTDPEMLFRLIDNLLRNVHKHTPRNTSCHLNLVQESGGPVRIDLWDEGPGISDSLLRQLNEGEKVLETPGVGLPLCQVLAEILKIDLQFSCPENEGLHVLLRFSLPT